MKNIVNIVMLAVIVIPSICLSAVGSGSTNILRVEVTDTFFAIYPSSAQISHDDCEDASKIVFLRSDFPNGYESMLSVALAAHVANKPVAMWFNGCKPGPWGKSLPKAESINVM